MDNLRPRTYPVSNLPDNEEGGEATMPRYSHLIEIRLKGQLSPQWSTWLEGMEVKLEKNGNMTLLGMIQDQSALLGVLNKLHALNLTILSFKEIKNKSAIKQILLESSKMETESKKSKAYYETIAWGTLFVWWGITELLPFLPKGSGIFGTGLILLGFVGYRALKGLTSTSFSIILGFIGVVWGGLEITRVFVRLPYEMPVFAITLIALGIFIAIRAFLKGTVERA